MSASDVTPINSLACIHMARSLAPPTDKGTLTLLPREKGRRGPQTSTPEERERPSLRTALCFSPHHQPYIQDEAHSSRLVVGRHCRNVRLCACRAQLRRRRPRPPPARRNGSQLRSKMYGTRSLLLYAEYWPNRISHQCVRYAEQAPRNSGVGVTRLASVNPAQTRPVWAGGTHKADNSHRTRSRPTLIARDLHQPVTQDRPTSLRACAPLQISSRPTTDASQTTA